MLLDTLRLSRSWKEGKFRDRPNRFTLLLEAGTTTFKAYLPNTGRLEEYCIDGTPFYVVPFRSKKFEYRVMSTWYQGNYVFLDTILMNRVVHTLLCKHYLPGLRNIAEVYPEKQIGTNRFDFFVQRPDALPMVIEVKTCTLSHNGVALFPDAPTVRARSHIEHLSDLHKQGLHAMMIFIIPNPASRKFIPNFHTDPDFAQTLIEKTDVDFHAYRVKLIDPSTVDLNSITAIPIDQATVRSSNTNRGHYLIILENQRDVELEIGNLGRLSFPKGYYVYIGSGLNSLTSRVGRHRKKRKKKHWHIDYITPDYMPVRRVYLIRRQDRIETEIVGRIRSLSSGAIPGFGSSDSREASHLLRFDAPPFRNRYFISALLDFKTFTEKQQATQRT